MVRQDVVINNYKYIIDVYKAETADLTENRYAEFVMLRNYEFSNSIVNDKDIYIIEKSLLNEYISSYSTSSNNIVFPKTNKDFTTFSTQFKDFNINYSEFTFIENEFDQYSLYKKDKISNEFIEAEIRCDKVRIYHPHIKRKIDAIIYCDTFIHNVHVHIYLYRLQT